LGNREERDTFEFRCLSCKCCSIEHDVTDSQHHQWNSVSWHQLPLTEVSGIVQKIETRLFKSADIEIENNKQNIIFKLLEPSTSQCLNVASRNGHSLTNGSDNLNPSNPYRDLIHLIASQTLNHSTPRPLRNIQTQTDPDAAPWEPCGLCSTYLRTAHE